MDAAFHQALKEYGRIIKASGWRAGEPFIEKNERKFKDFRKWARALAVILRTIELLKAGYPRS